MVNRLVNRILNGEKISSSDLVSIVNLDDLCDFFWGATKLREHFKGKRVFTCSIINAKSGLCSEDCAFCAQSKYHNTNISVYPLLDKDELVGRGIEMAKMGARRFSFVTSGKKNFQKEKFTPYVRQPIY